MYLRFDTGINTCNKSNVLFMKVYCNLVIQNIHYQLGIIYNIGDILQIGRFSSSGDNFVSDSGDCLLIGRTDFHPKKRNSDAHYSLNLRALQLSFSAGD